MSAKMEEINSFQPEIDPSLLLMIMEVILKDLKGVIVNKTSTEMEMILEEIGI